MSDQALSHPAAAAATPAAAPTRYWRTEDWIAVVLGFLVITAVLLAFQWKVADLRGVVPNLRWTTNEQIELLTPNWNKALDQIARDADAKGQTNVVALSRGLNDALATQDRKAIETAAGKLAATGSRTVPGALGAEIRSHAAASTDKVFTRDNLVKVATVGPRLRDRRRARHRAGRLARAAVPAGLPVVFALAFGARFLAGNGLFVDWGIEYVIFALGLGLLISNTIGTPEWLKPAVQTEFFVKTGLVILGASLIFSEVLQAGALGITQARAGRVRGLVFVLLARPQAEGGRRVRRDAVDRRVDLRRVGGDRGLRRDQGRQEEALLRHLAGADRRGADDDRDAVDREVDRHGRSRGRRMARRHARHLGLGGRGRRADQRCRDEDRRDREVLAERADRRRGVRARDLVGAAPGRRDRRAAERRRDLGALPKFVIGFVVASAIFSFLLPGETSPARAAR